VIEILVDVIGKNGNVKHRNPFMGRGCARSDVALVRRDPLLHHEL
jgi:hypothetical protein